ncbi:MAG: hypothetical protein Q7R41_11335, partial [Phycisphaerales bacterium]|nr:hypothetical protein [Phycisphaerales bacterium]
DDRDDLPTDRIDDDDFGEEVVGGDQFDTQIADDQFTDVLDNAATSQIVDRVNQSPFEDDFVAAERLRQESQIGPHGKPVDEFDAKFQQAEGEQAALQQQAPFVRVNPVSIMKSVLGAQVTLKHGEERVVARWDGEDAESTAWTVTVGPVETAGIALTGPGTPRFRPYALVQWGTRGFLITAKIDIGRGCQLTINASTIVLTMGLTVSNSTTATIALTGMLSPLPCVRTGKITCTEYATPPINDAVQVIVPAFAKNVQVYRNNATVPIVIDLISYGGVGIFSVTRAAAGAIDAETVMDPIPLPNDAVFITINNNDAVQSVSVVLIYELAL